MEFDLNADRHYDANGLGRLHFAGAPSALCLSSPCPKSPSFATGESCSTAFSLCSAVKGANGWLLGADDKSSYELKESLSKDGFAKATLLCRFENGRTCEETFELTSDGVTARS